jgi:hypothetical protein
MKVRIFKPIKNAMQSGVKPQKWHVVPLKGSGTSYISKQMGWLGTKDTIYQVDIKFETMQNAIEYAKSKGWEYEIITHNDRKIVQKSYSNNFKQV